MDADDVLWYSRSRKSTNDFARARRQQEVMRALFEKMITLEAVKRIPEFYTIYRDNVKTDVSLPDILTLLPFATQLTDSSHLHHYFIGPQETYDWITYDGAMVLLPRPEAIQAIMAEALNLQ
jgi:anionic cell wall polymer biosynthesis LytR-Cps2A-Psr (LCP) family protein